MLLFAARKESLTQIENTKQTKLPTNACYLLPVFISAAAAAKVEGDSPKTFSHVPFFSSLTSPHVEKRKKWPQIKTCYS